MKKLITLLCLWYSVAFAQTPYVITTPFGPGLPTTLIQQAIPELNEATGYQFRQESHPGAGGLIATNIFLNSRDPNKLLFSNQNVLSLLPLINTDIKYARADFKPVVLFGENYFCLAVSDKTGVASFADLVKLAKKQSLFYATSTGVNSAEHIMFQYMAVQYGLRMEAVHYKGAVEAQTAVVRGDVSLVWLPVGMCKTDIPGRTVLGYTTSIEKQSLPQDLHINAYMAMLAPKDISQKEVELIASSFVKVWSANREVYNRLIIVPKTLLTGKELEIYIDEQTKKWQRFIKVAATSN